MTTPADADYRARLEALADRVEALEAALADAQGVAAGLADRVEAEVRPWRERCGQLAAAVAGLRARLDEHESRRDDEEDG